VHVVKKGESAAQVARTHGLSLAELADFNPGLRLSQLSIGTRLRIQAPGSLGGSSVARFNGDAPMEAAAAAVPLRPLAAVPSSPRFASTPMPHLERLLPYQVRALVPDPGLAMTSEGEPGPISNLLSSLRPVMPPMTDAEYKALLPVFSPADPAHLDLIWPVETRTISSAWGPRMRTRTVRVKNQRKKRVRYKGRHKGIDLTAPTGTAVFAALDGEIIYSGKHKQYGNYVVVDHGNGVQTLYAHLSLSLVQAGDIVRRGQIIAEVGRTGNATGPHLHFELKIGGLQRNPLPVLNDEEEIPEELATRNALVSSGSSAGPSLLR
jgi:murein DD-endopeptidase MepM/ murein hydrolase activator NlpD